MDTLQYALYGIGALGLLPITCVAISAAWNARQHRRSARRMERFADRMGL